MGYANVFGSCVGCGKTFAYNPHRVPSLRVNINSGLEDIIAPRQPICRSCVEEANPLRVKKGLPKIYIHKDAYEPIHESEL